VCADGSGVGGEGGEETAEMRPRMCGPEIPMSILVLIEGASAPCVARQVALTYYLITVTDL